MQELEKILEEINENTISLFSGVNMISAKKVEKILRKNMNDGWIPVEKKLPNGCYKCEVTLDSGIRSIGWYNKIDYIWFDTKGDVIDVIAWKEPSEPYCPERSDNYDGE